MTHLIPLILLFVFLFAGVLAARLEWVRTSKIIELLSKIILPFMLLVMGYRIGATTDSSRELARSGMMALVFTLFTILGTFIAVGVLCLLDRREGKKGERASSEKNRGSSGSLFLFAMVVIGFLIGYFLPSPPFTGVILTDWLLRFLLFSIGIDLTKSNIPFFRTLADRSTVILPMLTLIGSLAGGVAASRILDINLWKGLSVSSGFGWYTLSGVLITDFGDPMLGSVAFLTNMMRETAAILLIPFLGPTILGRTGIAIAGATSMDVTLPLIERAGGPEMVPASIVHGVTMSLLVPFLVPLFFHAG